MASVIPLVTLICLYLTFLTQVLQVHQCGLLIKCSFIFIKEPVQEISVLIACTTSEGSDRQSRQKAVKWVQKYIDYLK